MNELSSKQDEQSYLGNSKWDFNKTNEWIDFAVADNNSVELVIGLNHTKPNSYEKTKCLIGEKRGELVNIISVGGEIIAVVADIPHASASSFAEEVQSNGFSRYIEPNMKFQTAFVPNDPYWNYQWAPAKIEADWAWNTTTGDSSVLVAVIDTGVDYNHPDLAANYVPLGYDWVNDDPYPMDDHGHGTHCAGIIAGEINNNIGIAGVSNVSIMAEKALNAYGSGYEDDLAKAIIHAVNQSANILSNSWGGYGESKLIHEAVQYAYQCDVLVIAAAGNDAKSIRHYPAGYNEVVAVSATDRNDNPAGFTNYGDWIELAAPGVDIYSTVLGNSYTYMSGTSMSCPHVAGVAALVWSRFPNVTRDWIRLWLQYSADDLGDPGFDVYYGYGRVNARKAVEESPPEHELLISGWEKPPYVEPGSQGVFNTTVLNFGAGTEIDIIVQLLVNGNVVDATTINCLEAGASATVSCLWNATIEGMYNVTSYVAPVPGETITENNVVWAYVYVGFPMKAFVLDSAGTEFADIINTWQVLNTNWYQFGDEMIFIDYTTLNKEDITYEDLAATGADVLIISCACDRWYGWEFTDSEIDAITRYIYEGHGLIATAGTFYQYVPNNNKLAPLFGLNETVTWYITSTDLLHIEDPAHPLFTNIPNPYTFQRVVTALPSDERWDSNELVGGEYLALGHFQESAIVTYKGLVYISPYLEIIPAYYHFHLQLLYNAITWSRYKKPEHELVVSLDCPFHLEPGETALLNATVANMGLSNETDVKLFLLVDDSIVENATIPLLVNGTSYTFSYVWTPAVEGTYNITAYSPPVLGESITVNNRDTTSSIVSYASVIGIIETHGESLHTEELQHYYESLGHIVNKITSTITPGLLNNYDVMIVGEDWSDTSWLPSEIAAVEAYINSGKGLVGIGDELAPSVQEILSTYGISYTGYPGYPGSSSNFDNLHPIMRGVTSIYASYPVNSLQTTSPAYWIANDAYNLRMLIAGAEVGGYVLCLSDDFAADLYYDDNTIMLGNIINWMTVQYEHELVVTLDTPTFLRPSDSSLLNATVQNRGLNNETDVELYIMINGTVDANATISNLPSSSFYTLNYSWTPTVEATYNVTAYAPPCNW
ncbi:MAG: S8 family serine peptidase [Thermoproteota archaeon]|nr:S8 family serine peptidase [Thermoproteota archaeon]